MRELPRGWRAVRLGDVARESSKRNDGAFTHLDLHGVLKTDGLVPMRDKVKGKSVERCKIVQPGSFAYNPMRLNIGSIARSDVDRPVIVSPDYVVFECDQENLDSRFLNYVRRTHEWEQFVRPAGSGSVRTRIYFSALSEFTFLLPPLSEQKKIAAVLRTVDRAIDLERLVRESVERVRDGVLHAHIGRFQSNSPEVPPTWEVVPLDSVARRASGHTPNKKNPEYWNGGIPWVSLKDGFRLDRRWITQTTDNTSNAGIENSSAVLLPQDTVIVTRDAGVGKVGILATKMATSQHFINYTCGPRLSHFFLYYWLTALRPVLERTASGNTIKTIGVGFFRDLTIVLPPREEQDRIVQALGACDDRIDRSNEHSAQFAKLRRELMHDLLTGSRRVKVSPDEVETPSEGQAVSA